MKPSVGMIVLNWRICCLTFDPCRQSVKISSAYVHIVTSANDDVTAPQTGERPDVNKSSCVENIFSQLIITAELVHIIGREINITSNILLVKL